MSSKGRRNKPIFESILSWEFVPIADRSSHARLATDFVDNVNAVPSTMAPRNALGLPIETYADGCQATELTHRILWPPIATQAARTNGNSTLDTPVRRRTIRSKPWSLKRKNLIGCKLLLVECLLLLL
jgi:hypothetical protein